MIWRRKRKNKWLLPKGGLWKSACGRYSGKAPEDIFLNGLWLSDDVRFVHAWIRPADRKDLGLPAGNIYITVAVDNIYEEFDTRPIRFTSDAREIYDIIEELREKVYDAERSRELYHPTLIAKWKDRLALLNNIYQEPRDKGTS